jgi:hypothetical protein
MRWLGLPNPGVIPSQLELDFSMGQQAKPGADVQRNGHLSLARYLHSNTPTSKCNDSIFRAQDGTSLLRDAILNPDHTEKVETAIEPE